MQTIKNYLHLEKLASRPSKDQRKTIAKGFLLPSLGLTGARIGLATLGTGELPRVELGKPEMLLDLAAEQNARRYTDIAKKMYESFGLNTNRIPRLAQYSKMSLLNVSPFEIPNSGYHLFKRNIISSMKNMPEHVIAHELGHAINLEKAIQAFKEGGPFFKKFWPEIYVGSRMIKAPVHMGSLFYLLNQAEHAKKPEDVSYAPAAAAAGLSIPTLIEEGLANKRALKFFKTKGLNYALKQGAKLMPLYGTYLLAAATPLLLTHSIRKQLEKRQPPYRLKKHLGLV